MDQDCSIRRVGSAAVAAALLAVAWPAQANLFSSTGEDPRVELKRSAYPYSAIGYMETPRPVPTITGKHRKRSVVRGTAFMISPCYALTAYHVVFGNDQATDATTLKHPVWISLGGSKNHFALDRLPAMAVAWGDYAHDHAQDWAVLDVVGCPGGRADIRWLPIEPSSGQVENRLAGVGGFDGQFSPFRMTGQVGCLLGRKIDPMTIRHYCASRPGMSGAPILVREKDHILRAFAIISREQNPSAATLTGLPAHQANLAVVVETAMGQSRLYPKIAADRAAGDVFPIATAPGR